MTTPNTEDPFDDLLSLEDQYYQEGYELGVKDGSRSGRIEGRQFGLEKGFEKFAAMGALAGQCAVWEARLTKSEPASRSVVVEGKTGDSGHVILETIPFNARLQKHLNTLSALTEVESLSTENNEDAVSDFDDRLKRAEGKAKVISSIIGESSSVPQMDAGTQPKKGNSNMEDFSVPKGSKIP